MPVTLAGVARYLVRTAVSEPLARIILRNLRVHDHSINTEVAVRELMIYGPRFLAWLSTDESLTDRCQMAEELLLCGKKCVVLMATLSSFLGKHGIGGRAIRRRAEQNCRDGVITVEAWEELIPPHLMAKWEEFNELPRNEQAVLPAQEWEGVFAT